MQLLEHLQTQEGGLEAASPDLAVRFAPRLAPTTRSRIRVRYKHVLHSLRILLSHYYYLHP
jgi:hypothetical protein